MVLRVRASIALATNLTDPHFVDCGTGIFLMKAPEEEAPKEPYDGPTFVRPSVMGQRPPPPVPQQSSQQVTGSSWASKWTSPIETNPAGNGKHFGAGKAVLQPR
jgi:hypothetical protein